MREIGEAEIFELCLPLAAGAIYLYWSLGGECLPLREIGEAEIFEFCGPGLGPALELFFFFFFIFFFFGGPLEITWPWPWPWPWLGADVGHFEAFSFKINVF